MSRRSAYSPELSASFGGLGFASGWAAALRLRRRYRLRPASLRVLLNRARSLSLLVAPLGHLEGSLPTTTVVHSFFATIRWATRQVAKGPISQGPQSRIAENSEVREYSPL